MLSGAGGSYPPPKETDFGVAGESEEEDVMKLAQEVGTPLSMMGERGKRRARGGDCQCGCLGTFRSVVILLHMLVVGIL